MAVHLSLPIIQRQGGKRCFCFLAREPQRQPIDNKATHLHQNQHPLITEANNQSLVFIYLIVVNQ